MFKYDETQRVTKHRASDGLVRGGVWRSASVLCGAAALMLAAASCSSGASSKALAAPGAEAEFEALKMAGAITMSATVTPASVKAGDELALNASVTSTKSTFVDVSVEIRSPVGTAVYSVQLGAQQLTPGTPLRVADTLSFEPTDPTGTYVVGMTVRHTGTGKLLQQNTAIAQFSVSGQTQASGACAGSALFCDDFTSTIASNTYTTQRGAWVRSGGTYGVTDGVTWERARALLAGDYSDFDVTLIGRSMGDAGFGLTYGAQGTDDGFAVVIHPAQFQGVWLKQLNPGAEDTNITSYALPSKTPGKDMKLRVRRAGTTITVWLDGTQVLTGNDGGTNRHGKLGLLLSVTDQTSGAGATFTLLRVDSATVAGGACTPQCADKKCGSDSCGGSCGVCSAGETCNAAGACQSGGSGSGVALGFSCEGVTDGQLANWVQSHAVRVAGTWDDSFDAQTGQWSVSGNYADWTNMLDLAVGGIYQKQGQTWAQAASGAYKSRWQTAIDQIASGWGSRDPALLNIRFAHEFNLTGSDWKVTGGDAANFKKAWVIFHDLLKAKLPTASLVWCPNDGTSGGLGLDIANAYPGSDYVDVIGVDTYNAWPWVNTEADFTSKLNQGTADSPLGAEKWRQFAEQRGKPLAIGEWGNNGDTGEPADDGGGGDSPTYIRLFHDWLVSHGGTGAGQIKYAVYFNCTGYPAAAGGEKYQVFPESATIQPNAAKEVQRLF
jgi:hypothetical protein